jgi:hypothetical protein
VWGCGLCPVILACVSVAAFCERDTETLVSVVHAELLYHRGDFHLQNKGLLRAEVTRPVFCTRKFNPQWISKQAVTVQQEHTITLWRPRFSTQIRQIAYLIYFQYVPGCSPAAFFALSCSSSFEQWVLLPLLLNQSPPVCKLWYSIAQVCRKPDTESSTVAGC